MFPNLNDCNYFKKSKIDYDGKEEAVMIYRLKSNPDYTFLFRCPKCGASNEFSGELVIKKVKEDKKNKEYILLSCRKCSTEFRIEKLKAAGVGRKKSA
ncbi:MAG: hypothetical protein M1433_00355 [Candidatus Parvarchaeota archaeon]|nr:hypothetical protein [Candidatus Parvarchaeota archaeon]